MRRKVVRLLSISDEVMQGGKMRERRRHSSTVIQLTEWFSKRDTDSLWNYLYEFMQQTNRLKRSPAYNTIRSYRRHFAYFCEWAFEQDLQLVLDPTRDFLLKYFEYRRKLKPDLSVESYGGERSPVKKFYDALIADGLIEVNVMTSLSGVRQHHRRNPNNAFSELEIQSILKNSTTAEAAIILLGARLGMRIDEIASLGWDEVDIVRSKVKVIKENGEKSWVEIGGELLDVLIALRGSGGRADGQKENSVVGYTQAKTIRKKLTDACKRSGINMRERTFSGLRNTWHQAQKQPFVNPRVSLVARTLSAGDTSPPKFEDLTYDPRICALLYDRWHEAVRMYEVGALRFTVVALGAVFEGALVALLKRHWKRIDMTTNPPSSNGVLKGIQEWKFAEMIDYAQKESVGWLHAFNGEYADKLRNYRNFVHPALELDRNSRVDDRLCKNLFGATKHMIDDLIRSQS